MPPPNPLSYPPTGSLVSSASPSDLFGLPRPGFPSLFSSPTTPASLGAAAAAWGAGSKDKKPPLPHLPPGGHGPLAPPSSIPKVKQQAHPPLESPGRNGSSVGVFKTNGTGGDSSHQGHPHSSHRLARDSHSRSPSMRPPSSASSSIGSPIIGSSSGSSHHNTVNNPSLDLSQHLSSSHVKNEAANNAAADKISRDSEITVVGEKVVNNHHSVPNGNPNSRPPSSHNSMVGAGLPPVKSLKGPPGLPPSSTYSDTVAKTLNMVRPPMSSSAMPNPFGLPHGLYPPPPSASAAAAAAAALGHPGAHPGANPFALDPFRDPYRAALTNPYLQSRESLLRLNQLMMTEQERIRMGLQGYPPVPPVPPATPHSAASSLFPPPSAATPSSLLGKPPTIPAPPLGYPPGYPPGLGLPLPSPGATPPTLNGHNAGGSSSYHAK